jgi:hypothetical protein
MESLYHAYEAYERRVERGEFTAHKPENMFIRYSFREPFLARFGDFLIRTGMRLKCRYAAGKSMSWSPMTWSKQ